MRVWDVPVNHLCRKHLLGEHRELHAIWTILTTDKQGYRHHPETKRWVGRLKALYLRHQQLVQEMKHRGYGHHSDLDPQLATGSSLQDQFVNTITEQAEILKNKPCSCYL